MKKNKGFTFIELLVGISILSTIMVVGVFSFIGKQQSQSDLQEISVIENTILNDKQLLGQSFTDYSYSFFPNKTYYVVEKNKNFLDTKLQFSFSGESIVLNTNSTGTGYFILDIFQDKKFIQQMILSATGSYDFVPENFVEYDFDASLDNIQLNSVSILPFSVFDYNKIQEPIYFIGNTGSISQNIGQALQNAFTGMLFEKQGNNFTYEFLQLGK